MEFLPQTIVIGGFAVPRELTIGDKVPREKFTRIFSEMADAGLTYGAFNLLPDGSGVQINRAPDDFVVIQPPLIQMQRPLTALSTEAGAAQAQTVLRVATSVLGVGQIQNLGVRTVYNAPLVTNDAKAFMLHQVLSHGGEHLDEMSLGGDLWGGVKIVTSGPMGETFTVQIEPAVADGMKSLYIDVDAQFPGSYQPEHVVTKVAESRSFVEGKLRTYLDKLSGTE
jgi:hypothetical protein